MFGHLCHIYISIRQLPGKRLLIGPTAVPGGCTIDIGPMMDVPKDMSVPRIIIVITAAVGHQTRHTTTYPTTTYPSRAQWEATVAGANSP